MQWKKLVVALALPHAAGLFGSLLTMREVPGWYAELVKPWFTPPGWVFGPVWLILYTLMGVALYLVWVRAERNLQARRAVRVFWVHLLINALWTPVFFGLHLLGVALGLLVVLWCVIAYLIYAFSKIKPRAGVLLVPYLAWVSLALALNLGIWHLN